MKFGWPIISILSRFTAVGIGLVQSLIIVKILSIEDYGLVGLIGSIGAIVGVYQNLGISSASTREIAATDDRDDAFKVFTGSLLVRYGISLPLVVLLFVMAPYIGNVMYNRPEIIFPLRLFAFVLFVQALQSVLNSVIQGLRKFKFLFSFQVGIAFVSLFTYVYFIVNYQFIGFYYALLVFNLISTIVLSFYTYKLFKGHINYPSKVELWSIIKSVFAIGIFVYFIKILVIQWQRLGPALLANQIDDATLGVLTFALLISTKITVISDAITDVSLPSMTDVFEKTPDKFKSVFLAGNSKAFLLILFASVMLILLKYEVFMIIDILFNSIGKESLLSKYSLAFLIMDPLIIAFWAYSHINLLKSGLSIPVKKMWGVLFAFILLFLLTLVAFKYISMYIEPLMAYSLAMATGALGAYLFYILMIRKSMGFFPLILNDLLYLISAVFVLGLYYYGGVSPIILSIIFSLITLVFFTRLKKVDE